MTFNVDAQVNSLVDDLKKVVFENEVVYQELHEGLAIIVDPYVPYLTGALSKSAFEHITPNGVLYDVPYAGAVYFGPDGHHCLDTHPLATSHWDEVAMTNHEAEYLEYAADVIVKKLEGK